MKQRGDELGQALTDDAGRLRIDRMDDTSTISVSAKQALDEAIAGLMRGERDPADMHAALEEMNRVREETRRRVGELNVAVDLIRDARK